jgi:hypothetical protein
MEPAVLFLAHSSFWVVPKARVDENRTDKIMPAIKASREHRFIFIEGVDIVFFGISSMNYFAGR